MCVIAFIPIYSIVLSCNCKHFTTKSICTYGSLIVQYIIVCTDTCTQCTLSFKR